MQGARFRHPFKILLDPVLQKYHQQKTSDIYCPNLYPLFVHQGPKITVGMQSTLGILIFIVRYCYVFYIHFIYCWTPVLVSADMNLTSKYTRCSGMQPSVTLWHGGKTNHSSSQGKGVFISQTEHKTEKPQNKVTMRSQNKAGRKTLTQHMGNR